jgi:hypothetical protein
MKWVLILIYVGGLGTPVQCESAAFFQEKDCRGAAEDFMKKHPEVTATCDRRSHE